MSSSDLDVEGRSWERLGSWDANVEEDAVQMGVNAPPHHHFSPQPRAGNYWQFMDNSHAEEEEVCSSLCSDDENASTAPSAPRRPAARKHMHSKEAYPQPQQQQQMQVQPSAEAGGEGSGDSTVMVLRMLEQMSQQQAEGMRQLDEAANRRHEAQLQQRAALTDRLLAEMEEGRKQTNALQQQLASSIQSLCGALERAAALTPIAKACEDVSATPHCEHPILNNNNDDDDDAEASRAPRSSVNNTNTTKNTDAVIHTAGSHAVADFFKPWDASTWAPYLTVFPDGGRGGRAFHSSEPLLGKLRDSFSPCGWRGRLVRNSVVLLRDLLEECIRVDKNRHQQQHAASDDASPVVFSPYNQALLNAAVGDLRAALQREQRWGQHHPHPHQHPHEQQDDTTTTATGDGADGCGQRCGRRPARGEASTTHCHPHRHRYHHHHRGKGRVCYICNESGHMAAACSHRVHSPPASAGCR